ncbi:MAG: maltotransferase domain-containing protein, partial [Longimicrobiales bacterium]
MAAESKSTRDRRRVIIGGVQPEIDCGRFACKRVVGQDLVVEADIFTDGHEALSARLLSRFERDRRWREQPMEPLGNDRWRATFTADRLGRFRYTIEAWLDAWQGWRRDMQKRLAAYQDVSVDIIIGGQLLAAAARRALGRDARALADAAQLVQDRATDITERIRLVMREDIDRAASRYPDLTDITRYDRELEVAVDPMRAVFSAWYELFPRSAASGTGRHGTFADVARRLDYIEELGFDVLYLPPIHPIGLLKRKGPNNRESAAANDVGSPWGIGSAEGGHTSVHPDLGTLDDFRSLVNTARDRGIEIALDIAFQAAPDHPWVQEHPDWFRERPDGTIQYAENPPKKYQDIYPFDFGSHDWRTLWTELAAVFD